MALGSVFSAVSGFSINIEGRGNSIWVTDAHPNDQTPGCDFKVDFEDGDCEQLIVTIGITRDSIANEVTAYLEGGKQSEFAKQHLYTGSPITSSEQANLVVNKLKKEIKSAVIKTGAGKVYLFYAVQLI